MAEQLRTTSVSSHLKNRQVFKGSQSTTWQVPEGTTEVWVHVWGGGGGSCGGRDAAQPFCPYYASGGGGGGYSRAIYYVTDTDTLSITVGGTGGTSSVSVPTQTPGSPLSATGGSTSGDKCAGGTGGTGSVTLNPTFPTYYCFTASGGNGGSNLCPNGMGFAGGGAAGSPLGVGGNGGDGYGNNSPCCCICADGCRTNGGGGIGGSNGMLMGAQLINPEGIGTELTFNISGGSALQQNAQVQSTASVCRYGCIYQPTVQCGLCCQCGALVGSVGSYQVVTTTIDKYASNVSPLSYCNSRNRGYYSRNTTSGTDWFYVEDIAGSSGFLTPLSITCTSTVPTGDGAGGGGGSSSYSDTPSSIVGTNGGFLGGGGGFNALSIPSYPNTGASSGGCAGGSGGSDTPISGTPGAVIIYW